MVWYSVFMRRFLVMSVPFLGAIAAVYVVMTLFMRPVELPEPISEDMGRFGYRCADGSEFELIPTQDFASAEIIPATSADYVPRMTLYALPSSSGVRYESGDVSLRGVGESLTLIYKGSETPCTPITSGVSAPLNFGD